MVRCSKCGLEVEQPLKEWDMRPPKGRGPTLHIRHYACPNCGKKFRVATPIIAIY